LTAALALRSAGLNPLVIESGAPDRVRPGSRAIFIHGASLSVLEKIQPGLGHAMNSHGLTWRTKRTLFAGREIYRRTYPPIPEGKLPTATSLPQLVSEKVLYQACLDDGIEFVWNTPVTGVHVEGDRVVIATSTDDSFNARYVIAADGARSVVRESAGLKLEGPQTSHAFVIVDAAEDPANPLPVERIFHYNHPAVDGRNVLYVPFAGHWRIDLQCLKGDNAEDFSDLEGARRWLPKVIRADYADRITWVSTYVFRQAVANYFTDERRRILLTGEAAHVFAPFGARGLNSGIPDAYLASVAIARALNAGSKSDADAAVDHFARSRRNAALRNRAASSTALHHLTAPTLLRRAAHRTAAKIAPMITSAGRWLDRSPYGPPLGPPDPDGMQY
jgi:3-(3-hydroxy-phenyl)propionate hydroxylase